jgi:hypothetical protein
MSRGSIVVCRPHRARESSALAPARAVGRSLVWKVMDYGMALNKRREKYRRSVEYAKMRAQAESDMLANQITSTATSYEPISPRDEYFRMMANALGDTMRSVIDSAGYVGSTIGSSNHEYARAKKRSEPDLAEAWGD